MYKHVITRKGKKYYNQGSHKRKSDALKSAKSQKKGFEKDSGRKALVTVAPYTSFGKKKYGVYLHPTNKKIKRKK